MIQVIVGGKGTGKTKTLIGMANKEVEKAKGEIVFISGEKRRMIELNHEIRLIKLREFEVEDLKMFYGFLSGIIAENYDVEMIYIDGLLEFLGGELGDIEEFLLNVNKLYKKFNTRFIISLNGEPESVPDFLKQYIA